MTIYIINHKYGYEVEKLIRLFYPNEKLRVTEENPDEKSIPFVYTEINNSIENPIIVRIKTDNFDKTLTSEIKELSIQKDRQEERTMAFLLYELLCEITGIKQPWGILTGVRPQKLFRRLTDLRGFEFAKDYLEKYFLVSPQKAELCSVTEEYERKIIELSTKRSFSLYISIPFCPTRCDYCSFVSQTIAKAKNLIEPYFQLLLKEIEYTAKIAAECKLRLETVYVGGGTPTTLSPGQLKTLILKVREVFDMSACREFTIEAGRPDTINEEKLAAILEGGVDRISINPQTFNDDILKIIGRKHTSEDTVKAFALARSLGFKHINMDFIAGLPTEKVDSFTASIDKACDMLPESITVHTLALKRSSRLSALCASVETGKEILAAKMLDYTLKKLPECGYHPYYLYRQTRMQGNLENVGWAREGFDCLYNVYIMDETHTILGCGAGAVTKLKLPFVDRLDRIFNYKYPYEYINGFEEMLNRKRQVKTFYDELS